MAAYKWPFWERKDVPWLVWSFNGSPELGRETDAIAESAYTIERKLCVSACDIIIRSAGKVVRPKPDRQRCLCNCTPQESIQAGAEAARRSVKLQLVRVPPSTLACTTPAHLLTRHHTQPYTTQTANASV